MASDSYFRFHDNFNDKKKYAYPDNRQKKNG